MQEEEGRDRKIIELPKAALHDQDQWRFGIASRIFIIS